MGERNNVTGSAKFKRLIKEDKFAEAIEIAIDQVEKRRASDRREHGRSLARRQKCMTRFPQHYGDGTRCGQSARDDRLLQMGSD